MKFFCRRFPVQVALGMLLVYVLTLSHGLTQVSLALTAKVAGWDWQPISHAPVLWLVSFPLRWLPASLISPALNFISAVFAATTLGLLARSLELMPWPRPLETLAGWRRLPVLLAVVVCGFQLSFWQEATAATGDMLDVLLLATVVWCLLEFRTSRHRRWLNASLLVWGLGLTQNWMLWLTLPLFGMALVVLLKEELLRPKTTLWMLALVLTGASAYAIEAMGNGLLPGSPWGVVEAWSHSLKESYHLMRGIYSQFWLLNRLVSLAVILFFLVPLVACLVRLNDEETGNKPSVDRFQIWLFRGLRGILLLLCLWLALDPEIGPRQLVAQKLNLSLSMLSLDYLNGLAVGFLAGNLLLMIRNVRSHHQPRHPQFGQRFEQGLGRMMIPVMLVLAAAMVLALVWRNASAIAQANRQPLAQYGELAWRSLPPGGGILLADYPDKLAVFQAAQARHGGQPGWLTVNTQYLPDRCYREHLARQQPGPWCSATHQNDLSPAEVLHLVGSLVQSNRVFYLHPSFGYLFEVYYLEPAGSVFEVKPFHTNSINPPALMAAQIAHNEKIWDEIAPWLESLQPGSVTAKSRPRFLIEKKLHLGAVISDQVGTLREWYSLSLNTWGVELQRNNHLPEAGRRFEQSMALNPNNWVARLNYYSNTNLQSGHVVSPMPGASVAGQVGSLTKLQTFINRLGPLDEPLFCQVFGNACLQGGLPRQAMRQFDRVRVLSGDALEPQFALAELYARCRLDQEAIQTMNQLHSDIKKSPEYPALDARLAGLAVNFWLAQTNLAAAREVVRSTCERHQENILVANAMAETSLQLVDFSAAERILTSVLRRQPDNLTAQVIWSDLLIQTRRASEAIPVLNRVLSQTNSLPALFHRAAAHLAMTNASAALTDYLKLQKLPVNQALVNQGLATASLQQRDTNQAIHFLTLCLTNFPPNSSRWKNLRAQIDAISPSPAAKK